jgi:preprotein translocase SecE subunit
VSSVETPGEVAIGRTGPAQFVRECIAELRRVSWPDRVALWQATGVVIGAVIAVGVYLFALDSLFKPLALWLATKQAG